MKKKVVFIVQTEYHFLVALSCIKQFYENQKYNIVIYRVSPINGKRLNQKLNTNSCIFEYKEIRYKNKCFRDVEFKFNLDRIIAENPVHFVFFQEHSSWISYLLFHLKKKGAKIYLAPDGAKIYENRLMCFKDRFFKTIKDITYQLSNLLLPLSSFTGKYYAYRKEIDEVWLESSSAYINYSNKVVRQIGILQDREVITLANTVFGFKEFSEEYKDKKSIVFFDMAISSLDFIDRNLDCLQYLRKKFTDYVLFLKLHPLASNEQKAKYLSVDNILFLSNDYPAEIYMSNFKNAIFVGVLSTGMFYNNPTCRYYFTYPLYQDLIQYTDLMIPFKHIKVVDSLEAII